MCVPSGSAVCPALASSISWGGTGRGHGHSRRDFTASVVRKYIHVALAAAGRIPWHALASTVTPLRHVLGDTGRARDSARLGGDAGSGKPVGGKPHARAPAFRF